MYNEFPYDDDLQGHHLPTLADFERVIRDNLQRWLDYLKGEPPLADLEKKAGKIMEDLGYSTFIPEVTPLAIELASAVSDKFERLKLWDSWHRQLLALFNPAMESPSPEVQVAFHECWMRFYLYQGDVIRASLMINSLLSITIPDPETKLAEARIAITFAHYTDSFKLTEEMLEIARATHNRKLLGRTYSVLAHYYLNRSDWYNAFQYGQMVYSVGIGLRDHTLISDGLHFIALAFKISAKPWRAFKFLYLAAQYSIWSDDPSHIDYLWETWAACYFLLGGYSQAAYYYGISARVFDRYGDYHTRSLHGLGTSLVLLKRYAEAEPILEAAQQEWDKLQRPIEQLYTCHALAELYSCTGRHDEAICLMQDTLAQAEALADRCSDALRDLLLTDLAEYIARRDSASGNS